MKISVDSLRRNYDLPYGAGLNLRSAKKMLESGEKMATRLGIKISIAIVDSGGNLVTFSRIDDSPLNSIHIAMDKAYSAVFGKLPTGNWGVLLSKLHTEGRFSPLFLHERWITLSGGFPIIRDRVILGGVAASGGTALGDLTVVRAMLEAGKFCTNDVDAAIEATSSKKDSTSNS